MNTETSFWLAMFRPRTDKWDTLKRLQSGRNVFEQDRLNKIEALKQLLK